MKKIIALVLSAAILLGICVPAFATSSDGCDCGVLPTIYVGPLGNTDIYENADTENERTLFRPDTKTILEIVFKVLPSLMTLPLPGGYDRLGDALIKSVGDAMGAMALDGNGNSAENVTVKIDLPTDPAHGVDRDYYFHYDWRLDPIEVAGQLDDFIQHVKKLTGHDKVYFRASSMGGVTAMAYFNEYGYDDVEGCIFQCCPILGTSMAGDLLCRKLVLEPRALLDFGIDGIPPYDFGGTLLYFLFNGLYYSGLVDLVYAFADKLLLNLQDRIFDELLTPVFGTILGLWAFVPDEVYEEAKKINLDPETQAGLIAKADYYHYSVQCRAEEILEDAMASGTRIMIVAGYDIQATPFIESYKDDSDNTVDTKYASVGAVVAEYNGTLGEDYVCKADCGHNHLSPDNRIDASTCVLPENTWFIKGMLHSNCHDGISEMYKWFLYSEEPVNVWSNPAYPQFLENDKPNLRVIAMGNFAEGEKAPEYEDGTAYYDYFEKYALPVFNTVFGIGDRIRGIFSK